MDLSITDFSFFGSYMSLTYRKEGTDTGLYLKSLHGVSKSKMESMRIVPLYQGEEDSDFDVCASSTSLTIHSRHGKVKVTFADDSRLVFSGEGSAEYGIMFDTLPFYNFEYSYLLGSPDSPYCIINSYKNLTRYLIYAQEGSVSLDQKTQIDTTGSCKSGHNRSMVMVKSNVEGNFYAIVQDIPTHNAIPDKEIPEFENLLERNQKQFEEFLNAFPELQEDYRKMLEPASYVLWSATVGRQGNLHYPAIYASVNAFPGVWSWDHCFAALALNKGHHEFAFRQMEVVFDWQDECGQLPGSVSDSTIRWNFCKPPIHGYIFSLMMKDENFTREEMEKTYSWISRQVDYYLKYKDTDGDSVCEYCHGNDSGQDNSTVFAKQVPVESPDLTAYLIKAMELLEMISCKLGDQKSAEMWRKQADVMTTVCLKTFFKEGLPVPREAFTKKEIHTQSLMPYLSLLLAKKLPKEDREKMINKLKSDFLTDWGLATEALRSSLYEGDAYWRGAIWAPVTLLMVEALEECGEEQLAKEISRRFCSMVQQHGFAENFNAKTGEGLRDRSFSWTAAVFLYLAHKLNG